jgi:hypothetical protein
VVQGLDLLAKQVEFQIGMWCANPGGVIGESMVAFGKYINRINPPHLEGGDELIRVEMDPHVLALSRRVKIKVKLAEGLVIGRHNRSGIKRMENYSIIVDNQPPDEKC